MDMIWVQWYGDNSTSVMLLPWERFICLLNCQARDSHSVSNWQLYWTKSISSTTKWKKKLAVVHDGKKQLGTGQEETCMRVKLIRCKPLGIREVTREGMGKGERDYKIKQEVRRQNFTAVWRHWYIRDEQHKTTERLGLVESVELSHCSTCTSAGSQSELEDVQGDFLRRCSLRLPFKAGIIMPTTQPHPSAEPREHLLFWTRFLWFIIPFLSAQMEKVKPFPSRQILLKCSMSAHWFPVKDSRTHQRQPAR